MSWLGNLNYYLLQWLGIRLAKLVETEGPLKNSIIEWQIIYPIQPVTGWVNSRSTRYKYLWGDKCKHITLWKRKEASK